jgi:hypothetical protein
MLSFASISSSSHVPEGSRLLGNPIPWKRSATAGKTAHHANEEYQYHSKSSIEVSVSPDESWLTGEDALMWYGVSDLHWSGGKYFWNVGIRDVSIRIRAKASRTSVYGTSFTKRIPKTCRIHWIAEYMLQGHVPESPLCNGRRAKRGLPSARPPGF